MCILYRLGQLEWRANESSAMLLVHPEVEWAGKVREDEWWTCGGVFNCELTELWFVTYTNL